MSLQCWGDRVEALVEAVGPPLERSRVIASCASTQDYARAMGEGSLVVAQQQTSGRGQRGNRWADTGDDGLAFSMCLAATTEPGRSALLAAAIVDALEDLVPGRLSLKHPNDVLLDGRKLAGVLIEQGRGIAVIGIGINVSQASWPTELEGAAISLAQAGLDIGRLSVLERVLCPLVAAWG